MSCELHENRYDKYRVLFAAVCCGDCVITMHILLYTVATVCNVRSYNSFGADVDKSRNKGLGAEVD